MPLYSDTSGLTAITPAEALEQALLEFQAEAKAQGLCPSCGRPGRFLGVTHDPDYNFASFNCDHADCKGGSYSFPLPPQALAETA